MSDRYLPFSSDDLERDMQDKQNCRVCGRACSSTVGVCRSPVCTSALVEKLEQQLAALQEDAKLEKRRGDMWWEEHSHKEQQLAELREAAGELVANAEWDGDISTVDTGDLKALRAALLQERGE